MLRMNAKCKMQNAKVECPSPIALSILASLQGGSMQSVVRRACLVALLVMTANLWGQDLASIEKRVTVKKLDNGLTLIVYERPEAPVFSYATVVNVGSAQEVTGITGLAHMFE